MAEKRFSQFPLISLTDEIKIVGHVNGQNVQIKASDLEGEDGATGPTGPQGQAGADGADGIDGTNGLDGTDGIDGEDGTNGTDGADGPQGADGPKGDKGDAGTGILFLGKENLTVILTKTASIVGESWTSENSGSDSNGKPVNQGDLMVATDILVPSTWVTVGPIQGPTGDTGEKGDTGDTGLGGTDGTDGEDGTDGSQGIQGEVGPQGIQGETGEQGQAGVGVFIQGQSIVATIVAKTAVQVGEAYIALDTGVDSNAAPVAIGDVLVATDTLSPSTWATIGPIVGPQGEQGVQGDTGASGADGSDGAAGAAATIAVGTVTDLPVGGVPTVTNSGTASAAVFDFGLVQGDTGPVGDTGPIGLTGDTGQDGGQGVQGETGAAGADGIDGAVGADGPIGATGPAGADGLDSTVAGPAGADGTNGVDGAQGDAGPQGIQGVAGATGAAGPTGGVGPKGDKGDTGAAGATGPTGPSGIDSNLQAGVVSATASTNTFVTFATPFADTNISVIANFLNISGTSAHAQVLNVSATGFDVGNHNGTTWQCAWMAMPNTQ